MSSGSARMMFAMRALRERWDAAIEQWDDKVAREFEKNHIEPLDHMATTTARGMAQMSEILQKVRHDCS